MLAVLATHAVTKRKPLSRIAFRICFVDNITATKSVKQDRAGAGRGGKGEGWGLGGREKGLASVSQTSRKHFWPDKLYKIKKNTGKAWTRRYHLTCEQALGEEASYHHSMGIEF